MRNKFDKLRDDFLRDLSNVTDNKLEETKGIVKIKRNKVVKAPSWFKVNKKPIIWGLSAVMTCLIVVITIISVINYKNIPVYREMVASNFQTVHHLSGMKKKLAGESEDEIIDKIGIIHLSGISCYAQPKEEILVTIKVDNPKSFEILSFTLNNYKYQSYEFVEGSNSTEIIVKFKVSETSGIEEITIDAIKYVDGESIKDVRFDGERTIKIGVTYQNVPNVSDLSGIADLTNYGISVEIKDLDGIIDAESGINIYLFNDENLLRSDKLNIGRTLIPYSNLRLGSNYTYIIIGVFDLLDGEGKKANILYRYSFTTDEGYNFGDITTDYDSAHINLVRTDKFTGNLTKVEIYKGEDLVNSIKPGSDVIDFSNLLSNTEYEVIATYEYTITENNEETLITKEIKTTIKTEERPTPTVEVIDSTPTKDGLEFNYDIMDTTDVGEIIKLEVYKVEGQTEILVDTHKFDQDIRSLTNLLSNNQYKFYATYQYDLLDGTGEKFLTIEHEFTTLPKEKPVITHKDVTPTKYGITFNYDIEDIDNVGSVISADLLLKNEVVTTITDLTQLSFSDLLSDNDYDIRINYQYDLNDGTGMHNDSVSTTAHTIPLTIPTAVITSGVPFNNTLLLWFKLTDIDLILNVLRVEVYKDDTLVTSKNHLDNIKKDQNNEGVSTADLSFSGLALGEYVVVIVYQYDLNDGNGIHEVTKDHPTADNKLRITIE